MARYKNESPSPEQQKFINLLAQGEVSQTEAHKLAGYSGDRGNAARLARKFAAEIAVAREKLGLAPVIKPEVEEIEDDDVRLLVEQNRILYESAVAAGDIKSARKSLTALERLLKKKKPKAGTPTPTAKTAPSANHFANFTSAQVWEIAFDLTESEEDRAAYEADVALWADYERERELAINGLPNRLAQTPFPGASTRVLSGGTQVVDLDNPAAPDAADVTPEQSEIVKRL